MKILGRIVAVLLLLVAVVLFVVASWNYAFQSAFFSAETFTSALDNDQFYVDLAPVALDAIIAERAIRTPLVDFGEIVDAIGEENWQAVTNELIPPEWLQRQIETGIGVFFEIVDGNAAAVGEPITVSEIRDRLLGVPAERAVNMILDSAPACTVQQNATIRAIDTGRQTTLPICNPRGELRDVSYRVLSNTLTQIATTLIGDSDLEYRSFLDNADENALLNISLGFDAYEQLGNLFYLCPLALLSLVVALVVRSLKHFGRWLGWTTIISGVLMVLPLIFVSGALLEAFSETLNMTSPAEELVRQVFVAIVEATFSRLSSTVLLQGAIFAAVGIILLIISAVAPHSQPYVPPGSVVMTPDGQLISMGSTPVSKKVQ